MVGIGTKATGDREKTAGEAPSGNLPAKDDIVEFTPNREAVEGLHRGDPVAVAAIYDAFAGFVHALIYRQLGPSSAVEDLVQQVFLRVLAETPEYRNEAAFRSWIRQATFFTVCRYLRGRKRRPEAPAGRDLGDALETGAEPCGTGVAPSDPERLLADHQIRERTWRLLERMPHDRRMAIVLHDFEGQTIEEGARIIGCGKFAFRSRLARARRELAALAQRDEVLVHLIDRSGR